MVVRRRGGWEVWTGLNNPALHPDHYVGNYLFLHDDGRVERVVRDADGFNDTMLIKRSDVDGNHT